MWSAAEPTSSSPESSLDCALPAYKPWRLNASVAILEAHIVLIRRTIVVGRSEGYLGESKTKIYQEIEITARRNGNDDLRLDHMLENVQPRREANR